jgi:hypothetical protein
MKETPTDFLIRSLEQIEDAEDVVLVVRRKGSDDIEWFANDVKLWHLLGMLEFAKQSVWHAGADEEDD